MNNKLIFAAIAVLGVTTAYAGERMKNADTDADGMISLAEFKAAKTARIAEQFGRIDKNADGYLSEDELKQAKRGERRKGRDGRNHRKMNPEKALTRLDADGSGGLSLDELQGKRFSPDSNAFLAADTDGSGELNAAELETMMKAHWADHRNSNRETYD